LVVGVCALVALNALLVVCYRALVVSRFNYHLDGCGTAGWRPQLDMRKYSFPLSVEGAPYTRDRGVPPLCDYQYIRNGLELF
jgi:hypothetical protein